MEAEKVTYGQSHNVTPVELRSKEMDLEHGHLGKLFGNSRNAPFNIAGCVVLLLIASGIGMSFFPALIAPKEYWGIVVPIITLVLGYLFGKNS